MKILIGKTAGFCYGVKRAVDGANNEIIKRQKDNKKIYCLGEIVHNKEVTKQLEEKGIEFIEEPKDVKELNSIVIIRAHGISKETYKECQKRNIKIADYTCPNVLKIHQIAEKYNKEGWYIFLVGAQNHPENMGTISYCGKDMYVIESIENVEKAIEKLLKSKKNKVLLISQTTYNLEKFKNIEKILKNKLPERIKIEVKNTICKATELRQKETAEISEKVDFMIIIGGKNSSNTKKIFEIAKQKCKNAVCIETKSEIKRSELEKYENIGIMAGASTPQISIKNVIKLIEECHKKEMISV